MNIAVLLIIIAIVVPLVLFAIGMQRFVYSSGNARHVARAKSLIDKALLSLLIVSFPLVATSIVLFASK